MIYACKKKLCATRNRAKFYDYQSVAVDRVVVKYIILFKIAGIVCKIIVNFVFSDFNIRACDNIL